MVQDTDIDQPGRQSDTREQSLVKKKAIGRLGHTPAPEDKAQDHIVLWPDPGCLSCGAAVTRRSDRVVHAEPPPPNPSKRVAGPKKLSRGQKRRGFGFDSDSSSDSENGKRRRDRNDGDLQVPGSWPPAATHENARSPLPGLTEEELARVQQRVMRRVLWEAAEKWEAIRATRQSFRDLGPAKRKLLSQERIKASMRPFAINEEILQRQAQFDEYLDEALYGTITTGPNEDQSSTKLTSMEEIIQHIEMRVLHRCAEFDDHLFSEAHSLHRFITTLNVMQTSLQELLTLLLEGGQAILRPHRTVDSYLKTSKLPLGTYNQSLASRGLALEFLGFCCPETSKSDGRTVIEILEKKYWERLVTALVESALDGLQMPIYGTRPDGSKHNTVEMIEKSRSQGHITPTYINWVCGDVDQASLDKFCVERHRIRRAEVLKTFRDRMAMVEMNVRQEFCCGVVKPGVVSLVLFKGLHQAEITNVSSEELRKIGWFADGSGGDKGYWRCELGNDDELGLEAVFKVNMENDTLGMFCSTAGGIPRLLECRVGDLDLFRERALTATECQALGIEYSTYVKDVSRAAPHLLAMLHS